jgi:hypothetical protein
VDLCADKIVFSTITLSQNCKLQIQTSLQKERTHEHIASKNSKNLLFFQVTVHISQFKKKVIYTILKSQGSGF